jgi:hypothetical protein
MTLLFLLQASTGLTISLDLMMEDDAIFEIGAGKSMGQTIALDTKGTFKLGSKTGHGHRFTSTFLFSRMVFVPMHSGVTLACWHMCAFNNQSYDSTFLLLPHTHKGRRSLGKVRGTC